MKRLILASVFSAMMAGTTATALAAEAGEDEIQARQGYYQLVKFNAAQLFAMAKGEVDYNAEAAAKAATNLKILSTVDNGGLWIPGTSKEEMPGKTRALKKIWDTYPEIGKKAGAYKKAVDDVEAVAGNGLDALRAGVGPLGEACKGCHDDYRADKF